MTDVLILGGTGWLSGRIARAWADAGADVTCLARGRRAAPEGTALVRGDRDDPDVYGALAGHRFDEVVDVSSHPRHVSEALAALGEGAAHWTYTSTVSVYAHSDRPGEDETADRLEPGDPSDYGRAKVASENDVRAAMGERAAVIRPGLIVGPGDPTDRFGYWVSRFALAGSEPVLIPDANDRWAQLIDVDDLARFAHTAGARRLGATFNAVGSEHPLADVLAIACDVASHTGPMIAADDGWLMARDVSYWSGPRSLPLWLPAEMTGFARRSNRAYLDAGGRLRPLEETTARTLADERSRGLDRERVAGLTRPDERALLADLGH